MKVGDEILFQEYPFFEFFIEGKRVLLVRELQVCAVLK
jgi:co-chaperonin GroES (HSP10)